MAEPYWRNCIGVFVTFAWADAPCRNPPGAPCGAVGVAPDKSHSGQNPASACSTVPQFVQIMRTPLNPDASITKDEASIGERRALQQPPYGRRPRPCGLDPMDCRPGLAALAGLTGDALAACRA